MPLIYITGPTGSGKTTICKALRDKGYQAYDTDDAGMRKKQDIGGRQLLTVDKNRLQLIYDDSINDTVFICGTSPTDLESIDLFSKVILLTLDEDQQRKRIIHRTNNDYGKDPQQLTNALKWRSIQIVKYQNAGAEVIDASEPIEEVIKEIILSTQSV